MDKKKVTRRAAIGVGIGGIAAAPLVIQALKARYQVAMPSGASARTVGGKIAMNYHGKEITLDIPRMKVETPQDEKKLKEIIMEQLKKNPQVVEVNNLEFKKTIEQNKKLAMAELDENEKRQLEQLGRADVGEPKKQALAKQTEEVMQACRTQLSENFDKIKIPSLR